MKSLLKMLIGRRARKIYLWGGISLVTLAVLFYQTANWRGAAAWKSAHDRLTAEGELFTMADLVPDPIPDAENFFAIPPLLDIAKADDGDSHVGPHADKRKRLEDLSPNRRAEDVEATPPKRDPFLAAPTDFAAWITYLKAAKTLDLEGLQWDTPAAQVLAALERAHGPLFEDFASAAQRPGAMVSPHLAQLAEGKRLYNISIPHYKALQGIGAAMMLRGAAAAQTGDAKRAEESLRVNFRVAQGCRNEALLISQLVALALDGMRSVMIWEAINAGTVDAGMLERVQGELANIDLQAGMLSAMRGELAGALDAIEWVAEGGFDPSMLSRPDGTASRTVALATKAAPIGWIKQNRAYMANWYLDYVILPMRESELSEVLVKAGELETLLMETKKRGMHPHKIMPLIAMPVITSIIGKVIHAEANRQMQILACALERHRLDAGDYPDALDALVPKYIAAVPADPCALKGETVQYQRDGARYRLWSIALDRESDGGTVDASAKRPTKADYRGDWVWEFPE